MKKSLILLLSIITLFSCDLSSCGDYETGPPIVYVEIVSTESGENIFTSGAYQSTDIKVVKENQDDINFKFITENGYNIIQFIPYSYSEKNTILVKIGEDINAKIIFDVVEYSDECHTNYFIENIKVENYDYEILSETGILRIKV